jgi:hypothetical protein
VQFFEAKMFDETGLRAGVDYDAEAAKVLVIGQSDAGNPALMMDVDIPLTFKEMARLRREVSSPRHCAINLDLIDDNLQAILHWMADPRYARRAPFLDAGLAIHASRITSFPLDCAVAEAQRSGA